MNDTTPTATKLVENLPRSMLADQLVGLGLSPSEAQSVTSHLHPESIYAALLGEQLEYSAS